MLPVRLHTGSTQPRRGAGEEEKAEAPDMRQFSFHTSLLIERSPHGNFRTSSSLERNDRSQSRLLRTGRWIGSFRRDQCLGAGDRLPQSDRSVGTRSGSKVLRALLIGPFRLISATTTRTTAQANQVLGRYTSTRKTFFQSVGARVAGISISSGPEDPTTRKLISRRLLVRIGRRIASTDFWRTTLSVELAQGFAVSPF